MAYSTIAFVAFLLFSGNGFGAACCAGGSSQTTIITGDFGSQLSVNYQNGLESYQVDGAGLITGPNKGEKRVREIINFTGSVVYEEYYQISLTLPHITNTYSFEDVKKSDAGVGDPVVQLTYEFLPELTYSPWKPRGFIFYKRSFARSTSIYDSEKDLASDAFGLGYDVNTLGFAFYKVKASWDFSYIGQVFKGAPRQFKRKQNFRVIPGNGTIQNLQIARQFPSYNLRLAMDMISYYEGVKRFEGDVDNITEVKSYRGAGFFVSYMGAQNMTYSLGYLDQGFLGGLRNINANRVLALGAQYNIDL